jgi:hypothetical protein
MALDIEGVIAKRKIRDWVRNQDVINGMRNDIDDYLFAVREKNGAALTTIVMDDIMEQCIGVARKLSGA